MTQSHKIIGIQLSKEKVGQPVESPDESETTPATGPADAAAQTGVVKPIVESRSDSAPSTLDDAVWPYDTDNSDDAADGSANWRSAALITGTGALWAGFVGWTASNGFTTLPALESVPGLVAAVTAPIGLMLLVSLLRERRSARAQQKHIRLLGEIETAHDTLASRLSTIDNDWRQAQSRLQEHATAFSAVSESSTDNLSNASVKLQLQMQRAITDSATISASGDAAVRAMESLMNALPKIEAVAARASEAMRESGQIAHEFGGQLEARIAKTRKEAIESAQLVDDA